MKAIIYCRKSTDREDLQTNSLDYQINKTRETAKQYNLEIVKEIVKSESAKTEYTREWFNELIEICKTWDIDYIIIDEPKRLSRNNIDTSRVIDLMDKKQIKWILATWRQYLSENSRDKFLLQLDLSISKMDNEDRRAEVIKKMTKVLQDGRYTWKAPFWYKNVWPKGKRDIIIDEENYQYVQKMFELKAQWYGSKDISEILEKMWCVRMSPSTIDERIKNEFYIWVMHFNMLDNEFIWHHKHWTFIDKETFKKAQERRAYTPIINQREKFPLKWIMLDRNTKKPLTWYITKWKVYYKNLNEKLKINISEDAIIDYFDSHIEDYCIPPELEWYMRKAFKEFYTEELKWNNKNISVLKWQITKLKEKQKKLLDIYCEWSIWKIEFNKKRKDLAIEEIELENSLNSINRIDNDIIEECYRTLDLLINLKKTRDSNGREVRILIISAIFIELFIDEKKELFYQENKLFELVKICNFARKNGMEVDRVKISNLFRWMFWHKQDILFFCDNFIKKTWLKCECLVYKL